MEVIDTETGLSLVIACDSCGATGSKEFTMQIIRQLSLRIPQFYCQ